VVGRRRSQSSHRPLVLDASLTPSRLRFAVSDDMSSRVPGLAPLRGVAARKAARRRSRPQRRRCGDQAADDPRLAVEMLGIDITGRSDVRNGMACRHRHAVVGPPCRRVRWRSRSLERRHGTLGQLSGPGLLEADHVRSGPLEDAPDGLEPRSERIQVPGRHSQAAGAGPAGDIEARRRGPPCAARVAPPPVRTGKDSPSRSRPTRSTPWGQPPEVSQRS
jgi:hypothetical protein